MFKKVAFGCELILTCTPTERPKFELNQTTRRERINCRSRHPQALSKVIYRWGRGAKMYNVVVAIRTFRSYIYYVGATSVWSELPDLCMKAAESSYLTVTTS